MSWEQAREYVARMRQEGRTDEEVRQALLNSGWQADRIEALLRGGAPPAAVPSARPAASPQRTAGTVAPTARREPKGLAIAALWLGIVSLIAVPIGASMVGSGFAPGWVLAPIAPLAIVLGIAALVKQQGRRGSAITGVVIAAAALFFVAPTLFVSGRKQVGRAEQTTCLSHLKQLSMAAVMYTTDWDGCLPASQDWEGALMPYLGNPGLFVCPKTRARYEFNVGLSGMDLNAIDNPFEVVCVWDAGATTKGTRAAHGAGFNFGYADGHAKWVKAGGDFGTVTPHVWGDTR